MLSISQPGRISANLVVSYLSAGGCGEAKQTLNVNGQDIPAKYGCVQAGKDRIEHFTVCDAASVNEMVSHLKHAPLLLLQKEIKVWAGNFNSPRYGLAPGF